MFNCRAAVRREARHGLWRPRSSRRGAFHERALMTGMSGTSAETSLPIGRPAGDPRLAC